VRGLATDAGDVDAPVVINTAGAWASQLDGGGETVSVRPIKGQMILLEQDALSKHRLERTIYSHTAYVVPRSDGRVVVGTTVEDCGFDKTIDDDVVSGLRDAAARMVPDFANAPVREAWAGLRPRGVDDAPLIGRRGRDGYFVAVGHYRNGILLTPLTAELLANEILASN
jgi:glycine oxidase